MFKMAEDITERLFVGRTLSLPVVVMVIGEDGPFGSSRGVGDPRPSLTKVQRTLMVKRAPVRAMSPTASRRLLKCRWSWAPRRHSQPEMAARGVMTRKHTMSQNSVRFSFRGPGSRSHWGGGGGGGKGVLDRAQTQACTHPLTLTHSHTHTRYLSERPGPALHSELGVAELAVAGVGGGEPLLQAALVHRS